MNRIRMGRKATVRSRRSLNKVTDFVGAEIKTDCTLCYPVRRGSDLSMKKLKVIQVRPEFVKGVNAGGRLVTIKNLQNTVVSHYA